MFCCENSSIGPRISGRIMSVDAMRLNQVFVSCHTILERLGSVKKAVPEKRLLSRTDLPGLFSLAASAMQALESPGTP